MHLALMALGYALMAATLGYGVAAWWAVFTWRRRVRWQQQAKPVSLLKPLCGAEPGLYRRLRSFCVLDHPCAQLVFGVGDANDPGLRVVARLQREFPDADIAVTVAGAQRGANPKVANLRAMLAAARHPWLIISDSDVHVQPDYARAVGAPLEDAGVGLVTCLYRGVAAPSLWSRLGAQFVNDWFVPAALLEWRLGRSQPAFGATIALRREVLDAIGGFAAVGGYLADDHMLGARVAERGLRCVLSPCVVETAIDANDAAGLWRRELRWMRTFRSLRPLGHALLPLSLGLPVTIVGLALAGLSLPAVTLAFAAVLARITLPLALDRTLDEHGGRRKQADWAWLMPLRDCLSVALWCASLLTRTVYWRGRRYTVRPDGKLTPLLR